MTPGRLGTRPAIAAVVAGSAVANVARSTVVPDGAHFVFNAATGVVVLGVGLAAGLDRHELGASSPATNAMIGRTSAHPAVVRCRVRACSTTVTSDAFTSSRSRASQ